ncbi:hypothetical protein COU58_04195 [Candidatus Pacearchaeota archaeon CG10_big_fil_rev_8_21_14_0_10_32_42]|nr:MAG: hypothetical protein COU58_04195 [Candidatus Pacearchaeota archaeon CG10_big_fil_rev_8_21_14_0_10_32_42]
MSDFDTTDHLEPKKEILLRPKKDVVLPKDNKLISEFSEEVAKGLNHEHTLFLRPELNEVVEIIDAEGSESFSVIKPNRFITHIEKFMNPVVEVDTKYGKWYPKKSISGDLANTILQSSQFQERIPKIKKIYRFQIPLFFGRSLQFPNKGYDMRFKSWLSESAPKITEPNMSISESKEIIETIFKEFCFKGEQDKTHAIAHLLTPFLRGVFPRANIRVPLFIYEANRERAGKDYCAGIPQIIYDGHASEEPPISTGDNGNQNEELRKKIVSSLIAGKRGLHFANNKGYLNNSVLESLITTPFYTDRVLGKNELVTFSNELDLSLSANAGMTYTADIANRTRFIRLSLDIEDANKRTFENPNLHKWILDNREKILSALYSFVRDWVEKGKPKGSVAFASFPEWAETVGGIMENIGYKSPCEQDKEGFAVGGDVETQDMKRLFELCFEACPNEWVNNQKIKNIITNSEEDIFPYLDFEKKGDLTKFGIKINKYLGRIFSDIKLLIKDEKLKGSRREYKFVNLVNLVNLSTIREEKDNISKDSRENVLNVLNLHKEGLKCDSCGELTSNLIQGIPICLKCFEQVGEIFK